MILGQKTILLSLGIAILVIFAAVTLTLLPRIRNSRAEAKLRRAARRVERERIAAETAALEAEAVEATAAARAAKKKSRRAAAKASTTKKSSPAADVPAVAQATAPAAANAAAPAVSAAPAALAQPGAASSESVATPSAMQDILSSVFGDEEGAERQAALLRGMSDVDMANLLTLAQQVIVQMNGGQTVTVVSSKELG
jgi:hypothetical protein